MYSLLYHAHTLETIQMLSSMAGFVLACIARGRAARVVQSIIDAKENGDLLMTARSVRRREGLRCLKQALLVVAGVLSIVLEPPGYVPLSDSAIASLYIRIAFSGIILFESYREYSEDTAMRRRWRQGYSGQRRVSRAANMEE